MEKIVEKKRKESLHLPAVLYNSILRRLEILSGKEFASKLIVFSAYKATKELLDNVTDLERFLREILESVTRGKVIKFEISKERGGIIRLEHSLEADSYGPSDIPVCYLTRGIIKAVAEKIIKKPVKVQERKCVSMGDEYCEFAIII